MNENANNDAITISIVDMLKAMIKRWWIFVIVIAVFVSATIGYNATMVRPMYAASGTMYVSASSMGDVNGQVAVNLSDVMLAQELVTTYTEILSSNSFMKLVADECGLGYSHMQIKGMISFSSKQDATVMAVRAVSHDPKEAHILAETVLNCANEEISRVVPGGSISVIDHAEAPVAPYSPNYTKSVMTSTLLAIVIVAVIIFLIEFFDDRLKNRTEVEKFGFPILAEIPYVLNSEEEEKLNKKRGFKRK